jgi:hypothetical protein
MATFKSFEEIDAWQQAREGTKFKPEARESSV